MAQTVRELSCYHHELSRTSTVQVVVDASEPNSENEVLRWPEEKTTTTDDNVMWTDPDEAPFLNPWIGTPKRANSFFESADEKEWERALLQVESELDKGIATTESLKLITSNVNKSAPSSIYSANVDNFWSDEEETQYENYDNDDETFCISSSSLSSSSSSDDEEISDYVVAQPPKSPSPLRMYAEEGEDSDWSEEELSKKETCWMFENLHEQEALDLLQANEEWLLGLSPPYFKCFVCEQIVHKDYEGSFLCVDATKCSQCTQLLGLRNTIGARAEESIICFNCSRVNHLDQRLYFCKTCFLEWIPGRF